MFRKEKQSSSFGLSRSLNVQQSSWGNISTLRLSLSLAGVCLGDHFHPNRISRVVFFFFCIQTWRWMNEWMSERDREWKSDHLQQRLQHLMTSPQLAPPPLCVGLLLPPGHWLTLILITIDPSHLLPPPPPSQASSTPPLPSPSSSYLTSFLPSFLLLLHSTFESCLALVPPTSSASFLLLSPSNCHLRCLLTSSLEVFEGNWLTYFSLPPSLSPSPGKRGWRRHTSNLISITPRSGGPRSSNRC